ncbi:MAG: DUF885 domain-containing protein, partial [Acidimicrobiales bacterium]
MSAATVPPAAAAAVSEVADRYVDELCAISPISATYLGVAGHDHEIGDLSPAGVAADEELLRRTLARLSEVIPHDHREATAVALMQERLGLDLERHEAGLPYGSLNVMVSAAQGVRQVFDLMPTTTAEEQEVLRARMEAVPDAMAGVAETYREGMRRGVAPARRQVDGVAAQCRRWAGLEGSPGFFSDLAAKVGGSEHLAAAAGAAEAAYAELARFLTEELAPVSAEADPVGPDRYPLEARVFTGAHLDLEQTYEWGWDELARIEDERSAVADEIVPGGSVAEAVAVLNDDPARVVHGAEGLRAWMQDLSDRAVADLNGTHFDIPDSIATLRCAIAPPGGNVGAYYTGPSEDLSRPGTMWWSIAPGQEDFSTWQEVTTVYHEGVPGHHLQVAQVAVNADNLTRFQRIACFVSGHGEGWALYAERLMQELGHLEDPGHRLGMLDGQALRAVRVVLDIGAHLGLRIPPNRFGWREGETWTAGSMRELLAAHTTLGPTYVADEVNRYLGWPGQAISYKVGERVWLQARADARRRQGDAFDLKAFHAAALDLGPLGLD